MKPFFLLLDEIRKPSPATLWLGSKEVSEKLAAIREEERLERLADNESVYATGVQI